MKTKVTVWAVGLAAMLFGFGLSRWFYDSPDGLMVLCALIALTLVSAGVMGLLEKGKYAVPALYVLLANGCALLGFII